MNIEIMHRPGNAAAKVTLESSEQLTAEAGAMIAMSGDIGITTTTHKKESGGILKAVKRMLAGESMFLNHFNASSQRGEIWLATTLPGDMMEHTLDNETLIVQGGSYVASEPDIEIDLGWQGFKSVFSGESIFWVRLVGTGKIIINSFGAIYPIEVDGEYIVDTGHIVAFNDTLDFTITKAGSSWINSFLSGEGLVCKFQGRGTVWCQSHKSSSFGQTLTSTLKPRSA